MRGTDTKRRAGILKRLLQIVIVLFGISFLTFGLMYLAPGDPVQAMYMANGSVPDAEILEQTREAMGWNDPFFVQYASWLKNCLHGDFGISWVYQKPVIELLLARLWPTGKLALSSLALMLAVSLPLGILSAVKKGKAIDILIRIITFLGVSMPNFWVGLLLLLIFAVKLGWVPVISYGQGISGLILPAVTLAFAMAAKYTRQVRTAFLEELHQDYVTGARCRGIKKSTILFRHVLPNAMLQLVTLLGLSFGNLLGGTAVVEVIFSYPGLGSLAVSAITARDYTLIQGYVLWVALIYLTVNLLIDISYRFMDPRIRERQEEQQK